MFWFLEKHHVNSDKNNCNRGRGVSVTFKFMLEGEFRKQKEEEKCLVEGTALKLAWPSQGQTLLWGIRHEGS